MDILLNLFNSVLPISEIDKALIIENTYLETLMSDKKQLIFQ